MLEVNTNSFTKYPEDAMADDADLALDAVKSKAPQLPVPRMEGFGPEAVLEVSA